MKIIRYELTKKGKYNVYLSNGEVLELYEKIITENELLLKREIDNILYDKINKDNKIYEYIELSIKYILIRLRSINEIKDYLKKNNAEDSEIDLVIQKLVDSNYLDDDRFTKAFIKDKMSFTNWGDYKIKMELQKLGVSSSIILDNMLLIDEEVFENRIRKMIEKDIKTNKKYSGISLKNKVYNHLVSQGYSKEKVMAIINDYDF